MPQAIVGIEKSRQRWFRLAMTNDTILSARRCQLSLFPVEKSVLMVVTPLVDFFNTFPFGRACYIGRKNQKLPIIYEYGFPKRWNKVRNDAEAGPLIGTTLRWVGASVSATPPAVVGATIETSHAYI